MSIEFEYLLSRNRTNLKDFCKNKDIKSYAQLLEYIKERGYLPCSEERYNLAVNEDQKPYKPEQNKVKSTGGTKKPATKKPATRRRKSSNTRKVKKTSSTDM
jgi:hypothetical protein